jgi:hypothetical protein
MRRKIPKTVPLTESGAKEGVPKAPRRNRVRSKSVV